MATPGWIQVLRRSIGTAPIMAVNVNAVVFNADGEVLLQQRRDTGAWCLPGGILELCESVAAAAKREVLEETGATVEVEALVGVYSGNPLHVCGNGDQVSAVTLVFRCRFVSGSFAGPDEESLDARFFSPDALPEGFHRPHLRRLRNAQRADGPVFD